MQTIPEVLRSRHWPLLVLLLLLIPAAQGLNYQEGIHLIRPDSRYLSNSYSIPEYLTVEDITFVSCLEEDLPVRNSLLCLDDNSFEDLDTTKWSEADNCYISSYNLEDFKCEQLILQAEYTKDEENYRMTKVVRVNKLSKVLDTILDTQYSDGGWRDPLSTAYGIWALSYFRTLYDYELDLAMTWLKDNRNEDKKCWPKSPCNVETSANILALLTLSNYTGDIQDEADARRVVNDARNWLEELQNDYKQGDTWTVSIEAVSDNTTLTLVGYDGSVLDENFTVPLHGVKNYSFEAETGKELIVISDDNVIMNISNEDKEQLIEYQGDNLSYEIPGPCWSVNRRGEPCDSTTTMYALMTPVDEEQKKLAVDWARDRVSSGDILGRYFGDEDTVLDSALYLYNVYDDDKNDDYMDKLIDWVLYRQNNAGSWDTGTTEQRVIPTAYAALALLHSDFNRSTEPIKDAEDWASDNEDNITRNNTRALSSAFYILRHNARPLLTSRPKILYVDQASFDIELYNPTTFDLKDLTYEFSEEVNDYISIETKEEIGAYSYRKLTVTRTGLSSADAFGFLTIKNLGDPVAVIPVVLTDTPLLNVTTTDAITVFGTSGELTLEAVKSSHEFLCTMDWNSDDIRTQGTIKLKAKAVTLPFTFTQALTKEDVYSGTLTCTAMGKESTHPISVYIERYAADPLTVTPEDAVVNDTVHDVIFTLRNNLDRDLSVTVSLDRYGNYFTYREIISLNPNEEYNLTLGNNLPDDLNLTSSVLVEFNVLGQQVVSTLLIDVMVQEDRPESILGIVLTYLIILIIIGSLGYVVWKFRDVIFAELNKLTFWRIKTEKRKELKKIKNVKSTEQHQAIINLFNIMRFQGKDDKDVAKRLLKSFDREDIKEALDSVGQALPILEEEEPEQIEKKK